MTWKLKMCVVALALGSAAPVAAKNFTVMVGQQNGAPALWFTPKQLPNAPGATVNPGDTITFVNAYANGFHNAHSIDAAFTFSCGSAGCTNSVPASGLWTAVVTVPASAAGKTIHYQCDLHGDVGMVGSINVSATTPVRLQDFDVN